MNKTTSRKHANIEVRLDESSPSAFKLFLVDHSSFGTSVNGVRVPKTKPVLLSDGDILLFGAPEEDPKVIANNVYMVQQHGELIPFNTPPEVDVVLSPVPRRTSTTSSASSASDSRALRPTSSSHPVPRPAGVVNFKRFRKKSVPRPDRLIQCVLATSSASGALTNSVKAHRSYLKTISEQVRLEEEAEAEGEALAAEADRQILAKRKRAAPRKQTTSARSKSKKKATQAAASPAQPPVKRTRKTK